MKYSILAFADAAHWLEGWPEHHSVSGSITSKGMY